MHLLWHERVSYVSMKRYLPRFYPMARYCSTWFNKPCIMKSNKPSTPPLPWLHMNTLCQISYFFFFNDIHDALNFRLLSSIPPLPLLLFLQLPISLYIFDWILIVLTEAATATFDDIQAFFYTIDLKQNKWGLTWRGTIQLHFVYAAGKIRKIVHAWTWCLSKQPSS